MKHPYALAARAAHTPRLPLLGGFLLALALALPGTAQAQLFNNRSDVAAASRPTSVAVGDVDGDGDLDLLTTDSNNNAVNVRLNNGPGSFGGNFNVPVGSIPQYLLLNDVDGDGDLDLLTANNGDNTVSVRLNDGRGSFPTVTTVAVDNGPVGMAVGDVNKDGRRDLLVAYQYGTTVSVYLGQGAGQFASGYDVPVDFGSGSVAVGDVDGDGDLDLLAASSIFGRVGVRLNDGQGNFANGADVPVGNTPLYLVLQDVNRDGSPDLLAANTNDNTVSVRLNDGWGNFANGSDVAAGNGSFGIAVNDLNNDGSPDLLVVNSFFNSIDVCLNDGTGTFGGPTSVAVGTNPSSVAVGDVDGDGDLDLFAANLYGGTVSVLRNTTIAPLPPTLTAVAPSPGGLGQTVTLTGTGLGSPTALSINGANALAGIVSNSGTSLVVRVPVAAAASGNIVITTANGPASRAFAVMDAPGNALAFDGVDDELTTAATAPAFGTGSLTLEAWVRTSDATGGVFVAVGCVGGNNDYWLGMNNRRAAVSISGGTAVGTSFINDGRWHHLAGVRNGTQLTIYVDGVAQNTVTNANAASPAAPLRIGSFGGSYYWPGSLDEVRLRNVAQVPTLASRTTPARGTEPGLVLAYNFDQGTPATASTGDNAAYTTLYDLVSAQPATLANFALASGNTTSNYVQSYALVVPVATTSTARTATGFTVNWTAPAIGTATSYLLDVSTTPDFASPIAGSPFATTATSYVLTGLSSSSAYYYRVRALNSALAQPDQGALSNAVSQTSPLPVELTAFTATPQGTTAVRLAWATASEKNSATFAVERSTTGRTFAPIGTVAAAGTSSSTRAYEHTDAQLPAGAATLYYRLKQLDADGSFRYSPVRVVALAGAGEGRLALFPNPATTGATLLGALPGTVVTVTDALGRAVTAATADASGTATLALPAGTPAGVYVVRAGSQVIRLTVE